MVQHRPQPLQSGLHPLQLTIPQPKGQFKSAAARTSAMQARIHLRSPECMANLLGTLKLALSALILLFLASCQLKRIAVVRLFFPFTITLPFFSFSLFWFPSAKPRPEHYSRPNQNSNEPDASNYQSLIFQDPAFCSSLENSEQTTTKRTGYNYSKNQPKIELLPAYLLPNNIPNIRKCTRSSENVVGAKNESQDNAVPKTAADICRECY